MSDGTERILLPPIFSPSWLKCVCHYNFSDYIVFEYPYTKLEKRRKTSKCGTDLSQSDCWGLGQTSFPVCAPRAGGEILSISDTAMLNLQNVSKDNLCVLILEQISKCFLYSWKDLLNAHAVLLVMSPFTGLDAVPTFFDCTPRVKKRQFYPALQNNVDRIGSSRIYKH